MLKLEVMNQLKACDLILHGGDLCQIEILEKLRALGPVKVVRGNNDKGQWAQQLPLSLSFEIEGKKFYMTHEKKAVPSDLEGMDVIIYGHSHQYDYKLQEKTIWLNPGGCGRKRFHLPLTMAILTIEQEEIQVTKINLE